MDPVTVSGNVYLDLVAALLTAMGGAKGANVLWRKYANGRASKYEPITKHDLREVMIEDRVTSDQLLRDIKESMDVMPQRYLDAVMSHYPVSAEREQRDMLVKILDRLERTGKRTTDG